MKAPPFHDADRRRPLALQGRPAAEWVRWKHTPEIKEGGL